MLLCATRRQQFEEWVEAGELLEHAVVYGEYKGIPRRQVGKAAPAVGTPMRIGSLHAVGQHSSSDGSTTATCRLGGWEQHRQARGLQPGGGQVNHVTADVHVSPPQVEEALQRGTDVVLRVDVQVCVCGLGAHRCLCGPSSCGWVWHWSPLVCPQRCLRHRVPWCC